jgi:class 3 adenylate cyclase
MNNDSIEVRKLSAILFSDIDGYNAMMKQDSESTLSLLEKHNEILFPIILKYNGTIIKTVGDAFLAVFDSCISALESAVEIQEILQKKTIHSKKNNFKLRIGIHLGETIFKNNEVFGNGVNIAARIQGLSEPGGICFSQTVFEQVEEHFKEKIIKVGPVNLKNIREPMMLFKIQFDGIKSSKRIKNSNTKSEHLEVKNQEPDPITEVVPSIGEVSKRIVIFSSKKRSGIWRPPLYSKLYFVFGSAELNYIDSIFGNLEYQIHIKSVFSSITLIFPKNIRVEIESSSIFGKIEQMTQTQDIHSRVVVKIKCSNIFGTVSILTA